MDLLNCKGENSNGKVGLPPPPPHSKQAAGTEVIKPVKRIFKGEWMQWEGV